MEWSRQSDDYARRMRDEVARVLEDPAFAKSPVLSRLLWFLAEKTAEGESLKSYTVAVDGLGRTGDDHGDVDTYARVTVARLRKALSAYYAKNPGDVEIVVDPGSYLVRIEASDVNEPGGKSIGASEPWDIPSSRQISPLFKWALVALLTICVLVAGQWYYYYFYSAPSKTFQSKSNFPTVVIRAVPSDDSPRTDSDLETLRRALHHALLSYPTTRLESGSSNHSTFEVTLNFQEPEKDNEVMATLIYRDANRVIWTKASHLATPSDIQKLAAEMALEIASTGGAIASFARRQGYDLQTPYGCWLRFTDGVQTFNTIGDKELAECAKDWFEASPDRPVAAFLYGWTLTDRSVSMPSNVARMRTLNDATDILRNAVSLNPDMAILHIALMRTSSFLQHRELVIQSADDALENAKGNRLVIGMAGYGLALWNDPRGASLLNDLIQDGDTNAWEHTGLFVAAMMREDLSAAGKQVRQLQTYDTGQPLLLLLEGAYHARTGQREQAQDFLRKLRSDPRIRIAGTDQMIDRLPAAPEVKSRLKEWIAWDKK